MTPGGGSRLLISTGQGDEVVKQMASLGRGEAAEAWPLSPESSDPSCLHCPVGGVWRLNGPREDGQTWVGREMEVER